MGQIKYRSHLALIDYKNTDNALIDSGATHIFLHSKSSFRHYQTIEHENVQSASGDARIVGFGEIFLPLNGGVFVQALFYVPQFQENIISVHKMAQFLYIEFGEKDGSKGIWFFVYKKETKEVLFGTEAIDCLRQIKMEKVAASVFSTSKVQVENEEGFNFHICASTEGTPQHKTNPHLFFSRKSHCNGILEPVTQVLQGTHDLLNFSMMSHISRG